MGPSVFSLARQPKSSQLELKVHANPRNPNASAMAAILNADSALTDHANNNLGINIKGFEAGSKEEAVTRVSTSHDRQLWQNFPFPEVSRITFSTLSPKSNHSDSMLGIQ